jgi:haloalkane dehalogenase
MAVQTFLLLSTLALASSPANDPPSGAIRTPDARFQGLPDFPYAANYVQLGDGMRMHYVDEGVGDPILLLHGEPTWGYLYRSMVPALAGRHRVVAPDFVGFGRSDKWLDVSAYTVSLHLAALTDFVERLDLTRITLVGQDWGGLLGLLLAADQPQRFSRLVVMNTHAWPFVGNYGLPAEGGPTQAFLNFKANALNWTDLNVGGLVQGATIPVLTAAEVAAYDAPFPDVTYKAGPLSFPRILPTEMADPAAPLFQQAGQQLARWNKPVLLLYSSSDGITAGGDQVFLNLIPGASPATTRIIPDARHFIQEDQGAAIAGDILEFLRDTRRPPFAWWPFPLPAVTRAL